MPDQTHGPGPDAGAANQPTSPASIATTTDTEITDWNIAFTIGVKRRYHLRWERIFTNWNRAFMALIVLSSSTIAVGLYEAVHLSISVATTGLTALGVLSFVFDWAGKSALHRDLYRRFTELERRRSMGEDLTHLRADMTRIEGEEVELRSVIWMQCHNAECIFRGIEPPVRIHPIRAFLAPVMDLPSVKWFEHTQ